MRRSAGKQPIADQLKKLDDLHRSSYKNKDKLKLMYFDVVLFGDEGRVVVAEAGRGLTCLRMDVSLGGWQSGFLGSFDLSGGGSRIGRGG